MRDRDDDIRGVGRSGGPHVPSILMASCSFLHATIGIALVFGARGRPDALLVTARGVGLVLGVAAFMYGGDWTVGIRKKRVFLAATRFRTRSLIALIVSAPGILFVFENLVVPLRHEVSLKDRSIVDGIVAMAMLLALWYFFNAPAYFLAKWKRIERAAVERGARAADGDVVRRDGAPR